MLSFVHNLKYLIFFVLIFSFFSCLNKRNDESKSFSDSAVVTSKPEVKIISDSVALLLSKEILAVVKHKDYKKFTSFIAAEGVRFTPYNYIDTAHDKKFSASEFLNFVTNKKTTKFTWGTYDGSGDKILLSVDEYFKKFVYDVDFLNAPQISLNKTVSKGNSLNNIDSVYKNYAYTEFYFPGFDKKYDGMDWRSLKLVFKKEDNKLYLVAVVHDQWTI